MRRPAPRFGEHTAEVLAEGDEHELFYEALGGLDVFWRLERVVALLDRGEDHPGVNRPQGGGIMQACVNLAWQVLGQASGHGSYVVVFQAMTVWPGPDQVDDGLFTGGVIGAWHGGMMSCAC